MLRYISKGLFIFTLALVIGACQSNAEGGGKFEYRGLYTPTNTKKFQAQMHTNHPDYDWGIWGHNIPKLLNNKATNEMYATVDGKKNKDQYCFSSPELYEAVRSYILDQYGKGSSDYYERISIMPNDNKLVCTCSKCKKKGNTSTNATPAVTDFITRLAKEFPRHQFFTSAYHTTQAAPKEPLPDNVGAFISSVMQLRVDPKPHKGYKEFMATMKAWESKCSNIYIWDYERNFDDYLSPFPCLLAMQTRLKIYRDLGVRGIFINGSGDDYSAFDDMQSHVLAQLLENPDIDVHQAIKDYFDEYYPLTSHILTQYYWGLESRVKENTHILPIYGTMQEMCESYLDPEEFLSFRRTLDAKSKDAPKAERKRLNILLTSLAYTQLELYRTHIIPRDGELIAEMLEILKGHSEIPNMKHRDEKGHLISDYIKEWEKPAEEETTDTAEQGTEDPAAESNE